ncbi:RluA family pseudouridine synthase [Buchnera aphidicola]|uniref:RluA family pseudouridine synthase n=1 Tax=Buchnera aphidicola TaxID=9 RepID=UPI0030EBE3E1
MKKTKVLIIKIDSLDANQRIDNFLFKTYKKIPKSKIYKILRTGEIRVNKKRIKPRYKLKTQDLIRIPPLRIVLKKKIKINIKNKNQKKIKKSVLYEDKYILIINKPSGIAVHSGSGIKYGIIEILRFKKSKNDFIELVHRIDKNTSGVLILAKKKSILKMLQQQFLMKKIKKKYLTIVHGNWPKKKCFINEPIQRKISQKNKKLVFIHKDGKTSKTYFKIIKKFKNFTLLAAYPITGRTHQIRIHASHIGHPILFDDRYGNKKIENFINNKKIKKNILLHAYKIKFYHPKNKKKITIRAPLEKKFSDILDIIQKLNYNKIKI